MLDEYVIKVTLVGAMSTGKTTLVRRVCSSSNGAAALTAAQLTDVKPTVGVEFSSRVMRNVRPNTLVRLQLWDTAGTERYAAVSAPVYRNAGGIIAVCDVTDRSTLTDLIEKWLPKVFEHLPTLPMTSVLVVCNKCDLTHVAHSKHDDAFSSLDAVEALEAAGFKGTLVMEASALKGTNVEDALALLCNRVLDKFASPQPTAKVGANGDADGAASKAQTAPRPAPKAASSLPSTPPPESHASDNDSESSSVLQRRADGIRTDPKKVTSPTTKVDLNASEKPVEKEKKKCPC